MTVQYLAAESKTSTPSGLLPAVQLDREAIPAAGDQGGDAGVIWIQTAD
jgi:hypothetical protein